jgi:hypothetical protein
MNKRILIILIITLCVSKGKAQWGLGGNIVSQFLFTSSSDQKQYFGVLASARYQSNNFFIKGFFSKLIPATKQHNMYDYNLNNHFKADVKMNQSVFGLGLGYTFNGVGAMTKPYMFMDFGKVTSTYQFQTPLPPGSSFWDEHVESISAKFSKDGVIVKCGMGFQFYLKDGLCLFQEATIDFYQGAGLVEEQGMAVHLGIIYYFE